MKSTSESLNHPETSNGKAARGNRTQSSWFGYFKHAKANELSGIDGWIRMRLRPQNAEPSPPVCGEDGCGML